jgi:transmembrane sensor
MKDAYGLLEKYKAGKCTPEEILLVQKWFHHLGEAESSELTEEDLIIAKKIMWAGMRSSMRKSRIATLWLPLTAAVAIIIIISLGLYVYKAKDVITMPAMVRVRHMNDVAPGGNKAVLTLANGSTVILDNAKNGTLANQGSISIRKLEDGQLTYDASKLQTATQNSQLTAYNTVSTPRGGEYQVVLPDGTRVWLNAASSLRFPVSFSASERKVELKGEAYFEVAKDITKPFHVAVNGTQVEVLGTHFNIMAYEDENSIKTTLLEGSVKISKGERSEIIKPGQQAIVNENIKVAMVDTENVVAWKNGLTVFRNADIKSIMRQISRWYDVEVVYNGEVPDRLFTGKIPRNANISKIFRVLELNNIHFKVENKKITVIP